MFTNQVNEVTTTLQRLIAGAATVDQQTNALRNWPHTQYPGKLPAKTINSNLDAATYLFMRLVIIHSQSERAVQVM